MKTTHTKGKWIIKEPTIRTLANAKLIAAAPELLEALNQMNVALTGHEIEPEQEAAFELMRQAIKKATS